MPPFLELPQSEFLCELRDTFAIFAVKELLTAKHAKNCRKERKEKLLADGDSKKGGVVGEHSQQFEARLKRLVDG